MYKMRSYFGSYCGAINCNTNQKYNADISLFRFPKDAERSKKWLINMRRADLMKKDTQYLNKNIRICALHFEACQFMNSDKKRLVWNAVPTLFDFPNQPSAISLKRKLPVPVQKKQKASCSVDASDDGGPSASKRGRRRKELLLCGDGEEDNRDAVIPGPLESSQGVTVKEEIVVKQEVHSDPDDVVDGGRQQEFEFTAVKGEPEQYPEEPTCSASGETFEQMGDSQELPLIIKEEIDCDDYIDPFSIPLEVEWPYETSAYHEAAEPSRVEEAGEPRGVELREEDSLPPA